jgi:16S rRNA (adenine1518-N6/adenine1519-N6)-dimethyltransferase
LQTLTHIKQVLQERGLAPRKAFGQNFLVDHNLIRKLVDASGVTAGDVVLEVGPGTGALTEQLLAKGCHVIACEIDKGLCALLRDTLGTEHPSTLTLLEGDCLDGKHALSPALVDALAQRVPARATFRLVANLPYGAATPLLMILLAQRPDCVAMFVTIQKEVGDRLAAHPSTKEYGPLSVLAQAVATVKPIAKLPPGCFWPQPDVTSAMLGVTRLATPRTSDAPGLLAFCQRVFENRRKQIGAALGVKASDPAPPLPAGVRPTDRAEALTVDQLITLAQSDQR